MAEAVGAAASIVTLMELSGRVIKALKDVRAGAQERIQILDELRSTKCLLEMLNDRIEDDFSRDVWFSSIQALKKTDGPMETLNACLRQIVDKVDRKPQKKNPLQQLRWLFDKEEVARLLSTIGRQKQLMLLALQNDSLALSQAIHEDIRKMSVGISDIQRDLSAGVSQLQSNRHWHEKRIQDSEERVLLDWLTKLNFFTTQDDVLGRRQEGTGIWFLETVEFKGWVEDGDRTLWCSGIPGSGKTILVSIIINHLQQTAMQPDIAIMYAYCNYKERNDHTVLNIISSLLQQLLLHYQAVPSTARTLYDQHKRRMTRPTLNDMVTLMRGLFADFSKVFVVVDALDEADEDLRLELVSEILGLSPKVRLLCTSRPLEDIREKFAHTPTVEVKAHEEDVRKFLQAHIMKDGRLKRHVDAEPRLLDEIVETILSKVEGMFLLAKLHLESLSKKHTRKAVRSALRNLPRKLDQTYDDAMHRIHHQDPDDAELAKCLLTWITFATRPMKLKEILHGLAVTTLNPEGRLSVDDDLLPQPQLLVDVCAGIVTIDKESEIIRLVHYTTQEYFDRTRLTRFPTGQETITLACLRYLQLANFDHGPCPTDEEMDKCAERNALLHYASQNWGIHARGDAELVCHDPILDFFQNKLAFQIAVQARRIPQHLYHGWSQMYSFDVPPLVYAASFGLSTIVGLLLQGGADINARSTNDETALITAASEGYDLVVDALLSHGADVDAFDASHTTALICAADRGYERIVEKLLACHTFGQDQRGKALRKASQNGYAAVVIRLLKAGAEANFRDHEDGRTALMLASESGHAAIVSQLLLAGADPDLSDFTSHRTALMRAADKGHHQVASCLVDGGADMSLKDSLGGRNALSRASRNGSTSLVRLLIESGADIRSKDTSGWTCFMNAVDNGHDDVVSILLRYGANPEDTSDQTVLMRAAEKGHRNVLLQLLEAGADLEARDTGERTALVHAVLNGQKTVVQDLLAAGADVRARSSTGFTAFNAASDYPEIFEVLEEALSKDPSARVTQPTSIFEAAESGDLKRVEQLSRRNFDAINARDEFGWTALMRACNGGHSHVARELLSAGADCNATDPNGWCSLTRAAENGHEETIAALLDCSGLRVDLKTSTGWTALMHAANQGFDRVVEQLLAAKADPSVKDISEWTPLMRSADSGYTETVKRLIEAGAELDAVDKSGWTALSRAADKCHAEIVQELCLSRADVSRRDLSDWSPLMRAASKGDHEIVRTLLLAGADVTVMPQTDWYGLIKKNVREPDMVLKEITGAWDRVQYKRGRA